MTTWSATLAVALAPTLAIIATYLLNRRVTVAVAQKVEHVPEKLEQIHEVVNGRLEESLARIEQLEELLRLAGKPVPSPPNQGGT